MRWSRAVALPNFELVRSPNTTVPVQKLQETGVFYAMGGARKIELKKLSEKRFPSMEEPRRHY